MLNRKFVVFSLLAGVSLTSMAVTPAAAQERPAAGTSDTDAQGRDTEPNVTRPQPPQTETPDGSGVTTTAGPQIAPATDNDVIVVTGTRASLSAALDVKRNTIGVVDAIAAEDIGKFPDQNVAESLQRITGVSIDRNNGEGEFITVRGLGPEFNTVLLNNRLLATENSGREFSFNILASELISGAEVYKSSAANLQEGGIGATVVIRTARPLDREGINFAGSIAGQHDNTSDKVTPYGSGVISAANPDQTFGALVSFVYDKRISQLTNVNTDGWITGQDLDFDDDGTVDLANVAMPRTLNYSVTDTTRERIGGTLAFDWIASDELKLTMDVLYAQNKIDSWTNQLGYYTDPADTISAEINENRTALTFARSDSGSLASDNIVSSNPSNSRTYQIGANAEWTPTDRLTLTLDGAHSNARDFYDQVYYVVGTRQFGVNPTFNLYGEDGIPSTTNVLDPNDKSQPRLHCCSERGAEIEDTVNQLSLDGKYEFDSTLKAINAGILFTNRKKYTESRESPDPLGCFYCGYKAIAPGSLFQDFTGNILGQSTVTWLTYDPDELDRFYGTDEAINQVNDPEAQAAFRAVYAANNNSLDPIRRLRGTGTVRENTFAGYIQGEFGGYMGDSEWSGVLGGRLIRTDVLAKGYSVQLLSIEADPADPTALRATYSPPVAVDAKTDYTYFLPSASFRLNLTDDIVFRIAGSRTLTRPTLTNLSLSESFTFRPPQSNTVSGGNPYLQPYLAWNADAAVDYFINDVSYMSLAGFYKKIDNFVTSVTQPEEYFGYTFLATRPTNAESGELYGFEAAVQYTFDFLPEPFDGLGGGANYTKVESSISFDPSLSTQTFNIEGLSDSANLMLFYEKGPVQFRAAYNWREGFLRQTFGPQSNPENINGYSQIDLSGSVEVLDGISLFGEVLNLTDENFRSYSSFNERLITLSDQGRRITAGVRATF